MFRISLIKIFYKTAFFFGVFSVLPACDIWRLLRDPKPREHRQNLEESPIWKAVEKMRPRELRRHLYMTLGTVSGRDPFVLSVDGRGRNILHHFAESLDRSEDKSPEKIQNELAVLNILLGEISKYIAGDKDKRGRTPLMILIRGENLPAFQSFLREPAVKKTLDAQDNRGRTALIGALYGNKREIARLLLQEGADPLPPDHNGMSPLMTAVWKADISLVERLLTEPEVKANINAQNRDGETALFIAVDEKREKAADLLLKAGADPILSDKEGWSPLMTAAWRNSLPLVERLLTEPEVKANINLQNGAGKTALFIAVKEEQEEITELLLGAGADPILSDKEGISPLMTAAWRNSLPLVERLLTEPEVKANINAQNRDGETALFFARAAGGEPALISLLQAEGAQENASAGGFGSSPNYSRKAFLMAIEDGDLEKLKSLLQKPVYRENINERADLARTVLFSAVMGHRDTACPSVPECEEKRAQVVDLLLKAGADPMTADDRGNTPLFYALTGGLETTMRSEKNTGETKAALCVPEDCSHQDFKYVKVKEGNLPLIRRLLDEDSVVKNIDHKNEQGESPLLFLARQVFFHEGHTEYNSYKHAFHYIFAGKEALTEDFDSKLALLLEAGLDPLGADNNGDTALIWAVRLLNATSVLRILNHPLFRESAQANISAGNKEGVTAPALLAASFLLVHRQNHADSLFSLLDLRERIFHLLLQAGMDPLKKPLESVYEKNPNPQESRGFLGWLTERYPGAKDFSWLDIALRAERSIPSMTDGLSMIDRLLSVPGVEKQIRDMLFDTPSSLRLIFEGLFAQGERSLIEEILNRPALTGKMAESPAYLFSVLDFFIYAEETKGLEAFLQKPAAKTALTAPYKKKEYWFGGETTVIETSVFLEILRERDLDRETTDLLLSAGADPVSPDGLGQSPLMIAVKNGRLPALLRLLEERAVVNNINAKDQEGRTALFFAVERYKREFPEIIDRLLQAGADPAKAKQPATEEPPQARSSEQADISENEEGGMSEDEEGEHLHALFIEACWRADLQELRRLLEKPGQKERVNDRLYCPKTNRACRSTGGPSCLTALARPYFWPFSMEGSGIPDLNPPYNAEDYQIRTEMAQLLLDAGADPLLKDGLGRIPFIEAAYAGNSALLSVFLEIPGVRQKVAEDSGTQELEEIWLPGIRKLFGPASPTQRRSIHWGGGVYTIVFVDDIQQYIDEGKEFLGAYPLARLAEQMALPYDERKPLDGENILFSPQDTGIDFISTYREIVSILEDLIQSPSPGSRQGAVSPEEGFEGRTIAAQTSLTKGRAPTPAGKEQKEEGKAAGSESPQGEDCHLSGKSRLYVRQSKISRITNIAGQIARLADQSLPYIKKAVPRACPRHCRQINSYRTVSQIQPSSSEKDSCPHDEAQESYFFQKRIPFPEISNRKNTKKNSLKTAHQNMADWILSTFVYPYYNVFGMRDVSIEFKEKGLDKACPSCSFYLDYSYLYERDGLSMEMTAQCGARRRLLAGIDIKFSLWNDWRCEPYSPPQAGAEK